MTNPIGHFLKIVGVVAVTFIGAGFSIMAFNNDVDVSRLFAQIYEIFYGKAKRRVQRVGIDVLCGADCRNFSIFQSFRREEIYGRSDSDGGGNAIVRE